MKLGMDVLDWGQTGAILILAVAIMHNSHAITKINETIRIMLTGRPR